MSSLEAEYTRMEALLAVPLPAPGSAVGAGTAICSAGFASVPSTDGRLASSERRKDRATQPALRRVSSTARDISLLIKGSRPDLPVELPAWRLAKGKAPFR